MPSAFALRLNFPRNPNIMKAIPNKRDSPPPLRRGRENLSKRRKGDRKADYYEKSSEYFIFSD